MAGFNRGTVLSTAIHEAYPGHCVQFLWVQRAPTKVRKLLGSGSNAEGWAHYTEQMMLDEGYGRPRGCRRRRTAPSSSCASDSCRTRSSGTPGTSSGSRCTPAR